jgi:hypothetical protein
VTADELEDQVDFTYRHDRVRLGDEVLIDIGAYLTRLLKSAGAAVDPDALPTWNLILGLGGREHFAAERVAVQKKDAAALAGEFGLTLHPSIPGASAVDIAAALAGCCETPWKLAAEGACADVLFVSTLEEAPTFVEIAHIVADGHGYAAEDVGVYIQPQHQGVTHHVEFSLPYDGSDAATREDMNDLSDDLAAGLISAGAYFSRPYGPWAQPVYNRDAASRDALRRVKAIFDPAGIMNPGKLCFGAPKTPAAARAAAALVGREA